MKTSEVSDKANQATSATYNVLLIAASVALMAMPFITTLNEVLSGNDVLRGDDFLTGAMSKLDLAPLLDNWIVPVTVRMVAVLVRPLGIHAVISQSYLYLTGWDRFTLVYISWNCIGWQSFILFLITLVTALRGPFTLSSKIQCLLLGAVGTFMMNLVRIVLVGTVAFFFGRTPALIFHDYVSTLMTIFWLFTFWFCAFNLVLERRGGRDQVSLP